MSEIAQDVIIDRRGIRYAMPQIADMPYDDVLRRVLAPSVRGFVCPWCGSRYADAAVGLRSHWRCWEHRSPYAEIGGDRASL